MGKVISYLGTRWAGLLGFTRVVIIEESQTTLDIPVGGPVPFSDGTGLGNWALLFFDRIDALSSPASYSTNLTKQQSRNSTSQTICKPSAPAQ